MTILHRLSERWLPVLLAAEWRTGLIAMFVALAVAMLARLLGNRRTGALACGIGLAAGWAWLADLPAWPHSLPERLPEMALIATAPAWFAGTRLFRRGRAATLVAVAALCGWWLAGAPHDIAHLKAAAVPLAVLGGWSAAFMLLLAEADGWRMAATAASLWAALAAIAGPLLWQALVLAPVGAALGALAAPPSAGIGLPAAAGIGAVVGATMLRSTLFRHWHVGAIDFVALAPLGVAWLGARLLPRFRRLGAVAQPAAALVALLGVVLMTFAAAALAGIR
jgi:hypothetical protein